MQKTENLQYEYKAKITLVTIFNKRYSNNIQKSESPDWLDVDKNIGIEVTRSLYNGQGELSRWHNRLSNVPVCEIKAKVQNIFCRDHTKMIITRNKRYGGYCTTIWVSPKHLIDSFRKKVVNINKEHYKDCRIYDLYICTQNLHEFNQEELLSVLTKYSELQNDYKRKFRYVYIEDTPYLYQLDLVKQKLRKVVLGQKKIDFIKAATQSELC